MESSDNRIIDRILNDAREERKAIIKEAKRSAEMLLEKQRQLARHSAEKEVYSLLKRAENEASVIKGKVTTDIKRRAGWLVLSEKERLVTSVLNEVKNRLVNLQKSEEYLPVLEKLIVDAGTVLDGETLEVMLNENDSSLPLKLNKLEKKIADETGVKTQLKISKQQIKAVGVIVKTNDGKIFVDNTFEAILSRRERELRLKIARILFSRASAS
ncbi:MAG: V-type ATP synthase subunit E family protein [Candidatus Bathyarchaeota archaeon]|nr:V-type ATP synthase subunit E family protein [Candidatus Bathyarchaeota archaeon]